MDVDEVLKWLAGMALTAVLGMIAFFQKRNFKRMDDFDERLRSAVSSEQLSERDSLLREEMQTMDAAKSDWLQRLCDRVEKQTDALTETAKEHSRQMQEQAKEHSRQQQKVLELILTRFDKQ